MPGECTDSPSGCNGLQIASLGQQIGSPGNPTSDFSTPVCVEEVSLVLKTSPWILYVITHYLVNSTLHNVCNIKHHTVWLLIVHWG